MRGSVHPNVGHRIQPVADLPIQIVQAREFPDPGPEILADIADSVFHLAFGSGTVRPAVPQSKSMMGGKSGKTVIPDGIPLRQLLFEARPSSIGNSLVGFLFLSHKIRTLERIWARLQMVPHRVVCAVFAMQGLKMRSARVSSVYTGSLSRQVYAPARWLYTLQTVSGSSNPPA
jgi:hypothetical protein